jgi:hypothetical protein
MMTSSVYPRSQSMLGEPPSAATPRTKTIPFDYVFQFQLLGQRGNKVQDVVEISMEGVFVALSVGYSLALDQKSITRNFQPVINASTTPRPPTLTPLFSNGVGVTGFLLAGMPGADVGLLLLALPEGIIIESPVLASPVLASEVLVAPSLFRQATIGADGTVTINFEQPISTGATFRVWDRTNDLFSQVFEVADLSSEGFLTTPMIGTNPQTLKLPASGDSSIFVYGPNSTVNVFVVESATGNFLPILRPQGSGSTDEFSLGLAGTEVPLKVLSTANQLADRPLSPGDALFVRNAGPGVGIPFSMFSVPQTRLSAITLGALEAGLEKVGADLTGGFRLNADSGGLTQTDLSLDQLSSGALERIFQTGGASTEDVSFLYTLDATGTGREYQNKAIHNIAGLGIANGDRPFRPFAKPVMFEPRSSIRIQVEEISGPAGNLFIVLQGYKMLGTGRIPA